MNKRITPVSVQKHDPRQALPVVMAELEDLDISLRVMSLCETQHCQESQPRRYYPVPCASSLDFPAVRPPHFVSGNVTATSDRCSSPVVAGQDSRAFNPQRFRTFTATELNNGVLFWNSSAKIWNRTFPFA